MQKNKPSKEQKQEEFSSFAYQDISGFLDNELDCAFPLEDSMVGINGLIDYNEDSNRIAYLSDYETV